MKKFIFLHFEKNLHMKLISTKLKKSRFALTLLLFSIVGTLSTQSAYSQIDYTYGVLKKGFRLGVGGGVSILATHFDKNPPGADFKIIADYDFNPYTSIGIEGDFGELAGTDTKNKYYYPKVKGMYQAGDLNLKVGVGQFYDFEADNTLLEALKRIYLGVGGGMVHSGIKPDYNFQNPNAPGPQKVPTTNTIYPLACAYFGTKIDLPIASSNRLELNPNFKYVYVASQVFDGYLPYGPPLASSPNQFSSNKVQDYYFVVSLSLKYKF
jgi:hypothetical protein